MSKWLHNTTQSTKSYLGIPISVNEFWLIPETKEIFFANDESLLTDVLSGEIKLSKDGSTDIIEPVYGLNFLKSLLDLEPRLLNGATLKCELSNTKIDLPRVYEPLGTIYSYNGKGKLMSFVVGFNSDNVEFVLEIDGEEVFNIDCSVLKDIAPSGDEDSFSGTPFVNWYESKKLLSFRPGYPVRYSSSVRLLARANSNSNKRDMKRYLISLEKES